MLTRVKKVSLTLLRSRIRPGLRRNNNNNNRGCGWGPGGDRRNWSQLREQWSSTMAHGGTLMLSLWVKMISSIWWTVRLCCMIGCVWKQLRSTASLLNAMVADGPHHPLVDRTKGIKVPCTTSRILLSYTLLFSYVTIRCLHISKCSSAQKKNTTCTSCSSWWSLWVWVEYLR